MFVGKGGYDRNLQRIQGTLSIQHTVPFHCFNVCIILVTDAAGQLSSAAENAYSVCSTMHSYVGGASHMTVYVAVQQRSFATQQCMLLADAYRETTHQRMIQSQVLRKLAVVVTVCVCVRRGGLLGLNGSGSNFKYPYPMPHHSSPPHLGLQPGIVFFGVLESHDYMQDVAAVPLHLPSAILTFCHFFKCVSDPDYLFINVKHMLSSGVSCLARGGRKPMQCTLSYLLK